MCAISETSIHWVLGMFNICLIQAVMKILAEKIVGLRSYNDVPLL